MRPWSSESFPLTEDGRTGGIGLIKKPVLEQEDTLEHVEELRRPEEEQEAIFFFGEQEEEEVVYAPGPGVSCAWSFHLSDLSRETAAGVCFSSLGL